MVLCDPDGACHAGQFASAGAGEYKRRPILQFNMNIFTLDDHDVPLCSPNIPEVWDASAQRNQVTLPFCSAQSTLLSSGIRNENVKMEDAISLVSYSGIA